MSAPMVRRLGEVRLADAAEVGGKAASLGELIAAGVRVPDGVVIAAGVRDAREPRWELDPGSWGLGPGPFAVRSSGASEDGAAASYAGMFETVLGVKVDDLGEATEHVLASAGGARVAGYATGSEARMAVIVQRMVDAVASGVALTVDPITGDRDTCVVTAVRGLGDRLVSGAAAGDEWVVADGRASQRRGSESAIDAERASGIAREARAIADARKAPQDIEWAIDGSGALWILQARPMTALPPDVSWSPKPLAGNDRTGAVVRKPSSSVLWVGNVPCQMLHHHSPPGVRSSPHANRAPCRPPRAAYSHSASVGSRVPAHAQ